MIHVVQVGMQLDRAERSNAELLAAWPTLADVATAAHRAGARVSVVQASVRDEVFERDGVRYHFVGGGRGWGGSPRMRALARAVASLEPDVVHVHGLDFPVQTRLLCATVPGVPILVQDHASRPPARRRRPLHRWGLSRISAAAFTAAAQARPFATSGVLRQDVRVFEVLESSTWFTPGDREVARTATGISGDPCLLWVGRLDANKDPMTVLAAVAEAAEVLPGLRLWCCYTAAPLLDAVRARIAADPELADRVHLLGAVPHEQVQELCRATDFLVAASRSEGSGYAVLEAIACGATPLLTDIPAFRRITRDGAIGALFAPGDARGLAGTIVERSRGDRATLRSAARGHFERHLSFEVMGGELLRVYQELVAPRRAAPDPRPERPGRGQGGPPPHRRRRVLVVTPAYPSAEAPQAAVYVEDQVLALSRDHDVAVLVVSAPGWRQLLRSGWPRTVVLEDRSGIPVCHAAALSRLPWSRAAFYDAQSRAARHGFDTLRRCWGEPDLIHAHFVLPAGWAAVRLGSRISRPVVLTEHTGPFSIHLRTRLDRARTRETLSGAAAVIAVSPALAEEMRSFHPELRIERIGNLVRADLFRPGGAVRRSDSRCRFLTVAALTERKGIPQLLSAARLLLDRGPGSFEVRIIGGGPADVERFESAARRMGLADHCRFLGILTRSQVAEWMRWCDVLVLPSLHESFGLPAGEAMACGKPVVATRCGGPEFVVPAGAGALVRPGSPEALSAAMAHLMEERSRFDPVAIRGSVIARFGSEPFLQSLTAVYERALDGAATARDRPGPSRGRTVGADAVDVPATVRRPATGAAGSNGGGGLDYLRYLAARGEERIHPAGRSGTRQLLHALPVRDGHRLLELGCGTGGTLVEVLGRHRVRIEAVDLLHEMLAVAKTRLTATGHRREAALVRAHAGSLPFRAESFDHVYAESVLGIQSAECTRSLLPEVFRVLRAGGTFAANEAIWNDRVSDRLAREINAECVRLFGLPQSSEEAWHLEDWLRILTSAGFEVLSAREVALSAGASARSAPGSGVGRPVSAGVTVAYRLGALARPGGLRRRREYRQRLARVRDLGTHVQARLFVLRKPA